MQSSFFRLALGMIFAVVLVYLLMTVNFQSWLDPFIILTALPGAMAGILWMLFVTGTTLSVPSLMGAIMCIGVATANSILMVTFANDERQAEFPRERRMLSAGHARMRPVLMTATAMILGMLPMALGMGEGGEQNAPLGRAVIGGLMFATVTTLFVVPIIYSYLRKQAPVDYQRRLVEREREIALMHLHRTRSATNQASRDGRGTPSPGKSGTQASARGVERSRSFGRAAESMASFFHHHLGHFSVRDCPDRGRIFRGLHSAAEAARGGRRARRMKNSRRCRGCR